ncbi:MAG: hypothetical protein VW257_04445, partial [Quisquiliibacterium sp.]
LLWHPLVLATMNTEAQQACARTFVNVLRDSLGANPNAGDFILPSITLSQMFPQQACRWLQANGSTLVSGTTVRTLQPHQGKWRVQTSRGSWLSSKVVLALPAPVTAKLLQALSAPYPGLIDLAAQIAAFDYDSIATVYLAWPLKAISKLPGCTMLLDGPDAPGQWLFDRGVHGEERIAAVVISAAGRLAGTNLGQIAAQVARQ